MTAYHATHPSPYADDCPDCAGYAEEPSPARQGRRTSLAVLLACFAVLLACFGALVVLASLAALR